MTFNVKEEVAKRHFFLKNILENSIGDEELEINRINYNILLKQIKERYFVKFVNGKKVLFATTFHNDKIFLFLDYNSFYICKNINDINSSIKKIKGNNKMEKKNLWILTEERPKKSVIYKIIEKFVKDYSIACFIDNIRILPILNPDKTFSFTYEVSGMKSEYIDKIYIKIVSGYSSFVDFLIFYQISEPKQSDTPIYAIEETKTDDSESRNTGIFQRASKFIYINKYYPDIKKIMLYSLQVKQKKEPTETNIFGTRCLLTLGIEIIGKEVDTEVMKPFYSIEELINCKNSMRMPPKGNVPIKIYAYEDNIQVSGRLFKSGGLSHDPNIGSLSLICATLRKLGWDKKLEIVEHGLEQRHVANATNKFIRIANRFNIILQGLNIPCSLEDIDYWKYDISGEKLGTIFIHLIVENFTKGFSIYENHAGCERGYFYTSTGEPIVVGKYFDKEKYKSGNKSQIIHIPDLVIADFERLTIINIEGKKEENVQQGIKELDNFDAFENLYIKEYYSEYRTILRTVVLYGSDKEEIEQIEVSFMLNNKGKMILGIKAPEIFKIAIKNLFDYWRVR